MRYFLGFIKLPITVYTELKNLLTNFAIMITIYKKYDSVLSKFGIIDTKIKLIGWLIYLIIKEELLQKNKQILELAILLVPTINFIISHEFDRIKEIKGISSKTEILHNLAAEFHIKEITKIQTVLGIFKTVLNSKIYKFCNIQLENTQNFWIYEQFDYYSQILEKNISFDPNAFDETIFVKQKIEFNNTFSPKNPPENIVNVRVTPIKLDTPNESQKIHPKISEKCSPNKCGLTLNSKPQEIHSLDGFNIPCRTIFNDFTPVSSTISLNSWLKECINKPKLEKDGLSEKLSFYCTGLPETKLFILDLIDIVSGHMQENLDSEIKLNCLNIQEMPISGQIRLFYFCIIESLLESEEKKGRKASNISQIVSNQDFQKGVILAACETILFIHGILSIKFEDLLNEIIKISAFNFWKIIPAFLKFDPALPQPIIQHFSELEKKILFFLVWQKNTPNLNLTAYWPIFFKIQNAKMNEEPENGKPIEISASQQIFFKKVLQQVAQIISEVTGEMKMNDHSLKEKIWETMKFCLKEKFELLTDRHLIHLVLCSIYAVCKAEEINKKQIFPEYKFNNIIQCYLRLNGDAAKYLGNIFHLVKSNENEHITIIEFYNKHFLPRMQDLVLKICSGSLQNSKTNLIIDSPLTESLPRKYSLHGQGKITTTPLTPSKLILSPMTQKSIFTPQKITQTSITPKLTPRTKALFLCPEAPMFRPGIAASHSDMRSFIKSKILEKPLNNQIIQEQPTSSIFIGKLQHQNRS